MPILATAPAYNPATGDTPIEGVVVELRDSGGNVIATTTTNENGNYYFGGLDPDNVTYTVTVAASNFAPGGVLEGLDNTADPDGGNDSTSDYDADARQRRSTWIRTSATARDEPIPAPSATWSG